MARKKVVLLVAPTGGAAMDHEGAHVPMAPEDIAAETLRCYNAGASVVHIHARDQTTLRPTGELAAFGEVIRAIRAKCDILIQTTCGIGIANDKLRPSAEARMALLDVQPPQDLTTIPLGSWDIWRPYGGHNRTDTTYHNTPDFLRKGIPAIVARGIPFEMEIADLGFLGNAARLADEGVFDRNGTYFFLDYLFGFGGMPATARHLVFAQDEGRRLFPQAKWAVLATGKDQFPMAAIGVALGCDIVRVGFEDNIYLPDERPAQHNHQLVEAMTRIIRDLGRDVATVDEARQVLGVR
jgi:3-keto-5-aminohexanoate cleavage enzyme